jgi:hypothetical protein
MYTASERWAFPYLFLYTVFELLSQAGPAAVLLGSGGSKADSCQLLPSS